MRKIASVRLLVLVMIGLSGCMGTHTPAVDVTESLAAETRTLAPQSNPSPEAILTEAVNTHTPIVIPPPEAMLTEAVNNHAPIANPQGPPENYLIYWWSRDQGDLFLYLIDEDIHIPILSEWDAGPGCLVISGRHQLAFSSSKSGKLGLYILNYPFVDQDPVLISDDPEYVGCPRSWSPDSQLLAITSNSRRDLVIWDGQIFSKIWQTPVKEPWHSWGNGFVWSFDNRLAFISLDDEDDHSEIFYWDGVVTSNISQNPERMDWFPSWGPEGQLAYESSQGGSEIDLLVWDGITTWQGVPDKDSFENIAPELTGLVMASSWDPEGSLTFNGVNDLLYSWDGQQLSYIEFGVLVGSITWLPDGRIVIVTSHYSNPKGVFVLDTEHNIIFSDTASIYPSGVWTDWNQLVYCAVLGLHYWDGNTSTEIVPSDNYYIYAFLPNGKEVVCSHG